MIQQAVYRIGDDIVPWWINREGETDDHRRSNSYMALAGRASSRNAAYSHISCDSATAVPELVYDTCALMYRFTDSTFIDIKCNVHKFLYKN